MNKTFCLQHISQTVNLISNLITRQYKFNLMAGFMEIESINPTLKPSDIAKELSCSTNTLQ